MDIYRIPIKNIIVIYDDLSLPLGTLRIRFKGSSGGDIYKNSQVVVTYIGQKGVEDVIRHVGGENQKFVRIRVGIGQPDKDVVTYVLQKWKLDEMEIIKKTIPRVSACIDSVINGTNEKFFIRK